MTEYEFDKLKTGDFVRDPERGLKMIFIVEGKSRNRVRGIEGIHRDMTVREYREGSVRIALPSFIIQNSELEQWEIIPPEAAKMADLLYSEDGNRNDVRLIKITDGTGNVIRPNSGGQLNVTISTPSSGKGGFKWKF